MQKQKISVFPCILIFAKAAQNSLERRRVFIGKALKRYKDGKGGDVIVGDHRYTLEELAVIFKKIDSAEFLKEAAKLKLKNDVESRERANELLKDITRYLRDCGCPEIAPLKPLREWLKEVKAL